MESKIQIDIDGDGQPRLRIDYRLTQDLRDRLVGRFLYKSGIPDKRNGFWAYLRLANETQSEPGGDYDGAIVMIEPMDNHILGLHLPEIEETVKRYISESPSYQPSTEVDKIGPVRFEESDQAKVADEWCVLNLPPQLYKKWKDEMFYPEKQPARQR